MYRVRCSSGAASRAARPNQTKTAGQISRRLQLFLSTVVPHTGTTDLDHPLELTSLSCYQSGDGMPLNFANSPMKGLVVENWGWHPLSRHLNTATVLRDWWIKYSLGQGSLYSYLVLSKVHNYSLSYPNLVLVLVQWARVQRHALARTKTSHLLQPPASHTEKKHKSQHDKTKENIINSNNSIYLTHTWGNLYM